MHTLSMQHTICGTLLYEGTTDYLGKLLFVTNTD
jgi:hypothetical protein